MPVKDLALHWSYSEENSLWKGNYDWDLGRESVWLCLHPDFIFFFPSGKRKECDLRTTRWCQSLLSRGHTTHHPEDINSPLPCVWCSGWEWNLKIFTISKQLFQLTYRKLFSWQKPPLKQFVINTSIFIFLKDNIHNRLERSEMPQRFLNNMN